MISGVRYNCMVSIILLHCDSEVTPGIVRMISWVQCFSVFGSCLSHTNPFFPANEAATGTGDTPSSPSCCCKGTEEFDKPFLHTRPRPLPRPPPLFPPVLSKAWLAGWPLSVAAAVSSALSMSLCSLVWDTWSLYTESELSFMSLSSSSLSMALSNCEACAAVYLYLTRYVHPTYLVTEISIFYHKQHTSTFTCN